LGWTPYFPLLLEVHHSKYSRLLRLSALARSLFLSRRTESWALVAERPQDVHE
jgi:hypothetical protein